MSTKLSKLSVGSLIAGILGFISPFISLIALITGFIALYKIKRPVGLLKGKGFAVSGIVLGFVVLILSLFTIINFRLHYRAFKLPSNSMYPTIKEDERILVDREAYVLNLPQRGDIIVFILEYKNKQKLMCKRIVGLPGEELEIKNGKIYINDNLTPVPEVPKDVHYANAGDFGKKEQVFKIPDNFYYVLGDNSTASHDSRYFGSINKKDIYGKVIFTYTGFPLKHIMKLLY